MGRWAQRRIRGGDAPSPAAAPPDIAIILSVGVQAGLDRVIIAFDRAITVNANVPGAMFTVDGETMIDAAQNSTESCICAISTLPGQVVAWSMGSQPNFITTSVATPDSGTTVPV